MVRKSPKAPEMTAFLAELSQIVTPSGAEKLWEWAATAKGELIRLSTAEQQYSNLEITAASCAARLLAAEQQRQRDVARIFELEGQLSSAHEDAVSMQRMMEHG